MSVAQRGYEDGFGLEGEPSPNHVFEGVQRESSWHEFKSIKENNPGVIYGAQTSQIFILLIFVGNIKA